VYGLQLELPRPADERFYGYPLRGLLGRALFDTVCLYADRRNDKACSSCHLRHHCAYPKVFKPVETDRLPPYWVHGWEAVGQRLRYDWYVLEAALPYLDAWLHGLQRHWRQNQGGELAVWDSLTGRPLIAGRTLLLDALMPLSPPAVGAACQLQTLSPLISKHRGDPLYGPLRTRLQRLIQLYGDASRLDIEPQPWSCVTRLEKPVNISMTRRILQGYHYQFELSQITESARELLQWGVCLHAGGHATVGCGAYRTEAGFSSAGQPLAESPRSLPASPTVRGTSPTTVISET